MPNNESCPFAGSSSVPRDLVWNGPTPCSLSTYRASIAALRFQSMTVTGLNTHQGATPLMTRISALPIPQPSVTTAAMVEEEEGVEVLASVRRRWSKRYPRVTTSQSSDITNEASPGDMTESIPPTFRVNDDRSSIPCHEISVIQRNGQRPTEQHQEAATFE